MPYITREDGERFIIPSYRDVLSAKKPSLLRREIMLLSSNYGEYITLQRKNLNQYEIAFSPDPGYLLGETIWHYFKRPQDLIYCEAIPNTTEAILVIVKSGIVYLDGSFPLDAIPEELVIFHTQQSQFDIYIQGDVPISQTPEEGKIALDASSVHSFNVLSDPVFPTLPVVRTFQLQLVEVVLKAKGIGTYPAKGIISAIVVLGLLWMGWNYITTHKKEIPQVITGSFNPYQGYLSTLTSPNPSDQIAWLTKEIEKLMAIPGWDLNVIDYDGSELKASVSSKGARTDMLYEWAKANGASVGFTSKGFYLTMDSSFLNRSPPQTITELNKIIAVIVDSMSYLVRGNNLVVGDSLNKSKYTELSLTLNFADVTPTLLFAMGKQFRNIPIVFLGSKIDVNNGNLSGSMTLKALGD